MSSKLKELPLNWEWKKIKDVLSLKNGRYLPKKKHIKEGDYKVYGANGFIGRYNEFYIKEKTLSIGRVGACGEINKVEPNTWITDNAMYVENYNKKLVLLDFLYYLLDSMNIGQFSSKSSQPSINQSTIKNLNIPLPPLEEQKQIVTKLDELFSSLEAIDKLHQEAEDIGKNVMSAVISSFLNLNEIFKKNNIPKNWKIKSIKEVIEYSSDSLDPIDYPNKKFNYLGLKNIESNSGQIIDLEKTNGKEIKSRKREFNDTDILYGKLRPYLNKVAIPDFNGICSTDILVLKAKKMVIKEYIYYYLLSKYVVDKTTELMSGTNLPRIRKNDFMNLKIPLPPMVTQKKIINKLDQIKSSVDFIIKQQETRDELLEKLPQSILEKAFAGEL